MAFQLKIICCGRIKQNFVREAEAEYRTRLRAQVKIEWVEVQSAADEALLAKIKDKDFVILLDEHGQSLNSRQFAKKIEKILVNGSSSLVFIIGSAEGVGDKIKTRADQTWSLSPLTFTYQMTRIILIEQIYRAVSIIKGSAYHK